MAVKPATRRWPLVAGALAVVLIGSAVAVYRSQSGRPTSSEPADTPVAILTQEPGGGADFALGRGVLRYDGARGCVYLEAHGVDGTTRRLLPSWPHGFRATGFPVMIHDDADRRLLAEGDTLVSGGGFHDPAELPVGTGSCGVEGSDGLFVLGEIEGVVVQGSDVLSCGTFELGQSEGVPVSAQRCLISALRHSMLASLDVTRPTVEGDPIRIRYRTTGEGRVEIVTDHTADSYSNLGVTTQNCAGLEIGSSFDGDPGHLEPPRGIDCDQSR